MIVPQPIVKCPPLTNRDWAQFVKDVRNRVGIKGISRSEQQEMQKRFDARTQ